MTIGSKRILKDAQSINLGGMVRQLPAIKDELIKFLGEWQNSWCHNHDEIVRTSELMDIIFQQYELIKRQSA